MTGGYGRTHTKADTIFLWFFYFIYLKDRNDPVFLLFFF